MISCPRRLSFLSQDVETLSFLRFFCFVFPCFVFPWLPVWFSDSLFHVWLLLPYLGIQHRLPFLFSFGEAILPDVAPLHAILSPIIHNPRKVSKKCVCHTQSNPVLQTTFVLPRKTAPSEGGTIAEQSIKVAPQKHPESLCPLSALLKLPCLPVPSRRGS